MKEPKTCEQYVLARLKKTTEELRRLKEENMFMKEAIVRLMNSIETLLKYLVKEETASGKKFFSLSQYIFEEYDLEDFKVIDELYEAFHKINDEEDE